MSSSPLLPTRAASKPLEERVDIGSVQSQLHRALTEARSQVDSEFGNQNWTLIDPPVTSFNYCEEGGRSIGRKEGLTFDLQDENFKRVLEIIKEHLAPIGFTEVVDSTNPDYYAASIYNLTDGGWVRVGKAPGKGLSISFETGCRPLAH